MKITEFEKQTFDSVANIMIVPHTDLSISHYGYEKTKPDKPKICSLGYSTFRLHFIVSGKLTLYINSNEYVLSKNHCFLLKPNIEMYFKTDRRSPARHYWVAITGRIANDYLEYIGFNSTTFFLTINSAFSNKIRNLFFANFLIPEQNKDERDFLFQRNLFDIITLIHRSNHIFQPALKKNDYIRIALEYFNANFTNSDFSMKQTANFLHLNPNYFSTLFKEKMGSTFTSYLSQKRIEYAISLMEEGETSISDIAQKTGIADASYFSKIFKKLNKVTPSQHIEKYRTDK